MIGYLSLLGHSTLPSLFHANILTMIVLNPTEPYPMDIFMHTCVTEEEYMYHHHSLYLLWPLSYLLVFSHIKCISGKMAVFMASVLILNSAWL